MWTGVQHDLSDLWVLILFTINAIQEIGSLLTLCLRVLFLNLSFLNLS